jgi:membrane protein implicated in regulation of membrane protease activity
MSPWVWAVGALLAALVELHAPGYYVIWIAAGAGLTAIIGFLFDPALETQLAVFSAASLCCCVIGYFVYRRITRPHAASLVNERNAQMIGARGIVAEDFANGQGKVRLGDTVWLAEGPDLPKGAPVVVKAMRGTKAVVAPAV